MALLKSALLDLVASSDVVFFFSRIKRQFIGEPIGRAFQCSTNVNLKFLAIG